MEEGLQLQRVEFAFIMPIEDRTIRTFVAFLKIREWQFLVTVYIESPLIYGDNRTVLLETYVRISTPDEAEALRWIMLATKQPITNHGSDH